MEGHPKSPNTKKTSTFDNIQQRPAVFWSPIVSTAIENIRKWNMALAQAK